MEFSYNYSTAPVHFEKSKLIKSALSQFSTISENTQDSIIELSGNDQENTQSLTRVLDFLNNYNKGSISQTDIQQLRNLRTSLLAKVKAISNNESSEGSEELLQSLAEEWSTLTTSVQQIKERKQITETSETQQPQVSPEKLNFRRAVEVFEQAKALYGEDSDEFKNAKAVFVDSYYAVAA